MRRSLRIRLMAASAAPKTGRLASASCVALFGYAFPSAAWAPVDGDRSWSFSRTGDKWQ